MCCRRCRQWRPRGVQVGPLVATATDPLGNTVQATNDFRVLAPSQVTDPNLNRVQVQFDALGMVVATAVMGKTSENLGDTLAAPTTQMIYDLLRWQNAGTPVVVHTLARQVHQVAGFLESFTYSDGFGRVAMTKVQAEPDPLTPTVARWVGTGRTVFNNKGNPVKQYEPFFSATSDFENETTVVQTGVTPIIHYDALDRVVRTELPNKTESRVEFDVWQQIASDPNDTVLGTTWYSDRNNPDPTGPTPSDPEQRAAYLAARTANTPTTTQFDSLGRAFLVTEVNRTWNDTPTPATFTDALFLTRTVLDVEGNALSTIDARQAALNPTTPLPTLKQRFDVLSRPQRTDSIDAGTRVLLSDVAGKPLRRWDTRFQAFRFQYDQLQRPSHLVVQKNKAEQTTDDLTPRLLLRTIYGEALDPVGPPPTQITTTTPASPAQALNLRGQPYLIFDCAGEVTNDQFDFKANLLSSTRRLAADFTTEPKWNTAPNDLTGLTDPTAVQIAANNYLDPISTTPLTKFQVQAAYDALNRFTSRTAPDGSVTLPTYNQAGLLETLKVAVGTSATPGTVVSNINYNARGQRVLYDYSDPTITPSPANPATTCEVTYTYDPFTFRLTRLTTNRAASSVVTAAVLQDLVYTYDPVGNVVETDDNADPTPVFSFTTPPVAATGLYRYDSLYRLIAAQGREHPGQQQPTGTFNIRIENIPHPNDLQALVQYIESYTYDQVGNIQKIAHTPVGSESGVTWTRNYQYDTASNRLTGTSAPGDGTGIFSDTYSYSGNGAMTRMTSLPVIDWDYADRMHHANMGPGGGDAFFTYDGGGQRVRKVFKPSTGTITLTERIYIGGWETFRSRDGGTITSPVTKEIQTLHVMDDKRRIAMVERTTTGGTPATAGPLWRFQLTNLIDSAVMELDAQGRVISYEEYHPYGSTAFRSSDASSEVSPKRYRFTGKERDEETGLYYHGARYYAPWLGRWTGADPAGFVDGPNLYCYSRNDPVRMIDPSGRASTTPDRDAAAKARAEDLTRKQGEVRMLKFKQDELIAKTQRAAVTLQNMEEGGRAPKRDLRRQESDIAKLVKEAKRLNEPINRLDEQIAALKDEVARDIELRSVNIENEANLYEATPEGAARAGKEFDIKLKATRQALPSSSGRPIAPELGGTTEAPGGVRVPGEPEVPGGAKGGGGTGLAALGAVQAAVGQALAERDAKVARQGARVYSVPDLEGNPVTLQSATYRWDLFDFFGTFTKTYQGGPKKGQTVEIEHGEYLFLEEKFQGLYGYFDLLGNAVVGPLTGMKVRPEHEVSPPNTY